MVKKLDILDVGVYSNYEYLEIVKDEVLRE